MKIKKFVIENIFGDGRVSLNLDKDVNIFVGENGLGKTTILNILNSFLSGDSTEMYSLPFTKAEMILENNSVLSFENSINQFTDNETYDYGENEYMETIYRILKRELPPDYMIDFCKGESAKINRTAHIMLRRRGYNVSSDSFDNLRKYINEHHQEYRLIEKIRDDYGIKVLYFPTYRRVEADLDKSNLSSSTIEEIRKGLSVNFGMKDIENEIQNKLNAIKTTIVEGFNELAVRIISDYARKTNVSQKTLSVEKLNNVLGMLDEKIDSNDIETIKQMVSDGTVKNDEVIYNFLVKLVELYDYQLDEISKLEIFCKKCNSYLINKTIVFDKKKMNMYVQVNSLNGKSNDIGLKDLSSGEKQIISIFGKLLLNDYGDKYVVLMDEPELSLSLDWQRKLLPDMVETGRCESIIAVTHSPFIFDNDYRNNAVYIKDCFEEKN